MQNLQDLVDRARNTEHGFKDLAAAAEEVCAGAEAGKVAVALLHSDVPQARCIGTFILGRLASREPEALRLLKETVSRDSDWRVQEILAKAFDQFCADRGYEAALPVIGEWLADPSANVRRAVTEGLRIWTGRPYFRDHPQVAIDLLVPFRNDDSEYLRKSAGNALRDIGKRHPALLRQAVAGWNLEERGTRQTYKLATRLLAPEGHPPGA